MTIYQTIQSHYLEARKNKETNKISLLSTLINDIKESILKGMSASQYGILNPTDEQCISVILQYIKNTNQTLSLQPNSEKAIYELKVLESYLPPKLSDTEIECLYKAYKLSDKSPSSKLYGAFMKHLREGYLGRYEPSQVKSIVDQIEKG